jgi:hypothetical protein
MTRLIIIGRSTTLDRIGTTVTALLLAAAPARLLAGALAAAAGGGGTGASGFNQIASYINTVSSYFLILGGPLAFLGLVAAGIMLISGNPMAPRIGIGVLIGVVVLLAAKGLAA